MKIADLSHYNDCYDWDKIRQEVSLIIFRASIGNNIDKKYVQYANECGIPYGVYHYVKASNVSEAEYEATFFVDCARKAAIQPLFYIADIEYKTQTKDNTNLICETFLKKLKGLGCRKVGLYISQEKRAYLKENVLSMCDIMWIPRYGKNDGNIPEDKYLPKYNCDLWQYTDRGKVSGIAGFVDLNKEMQKLNIYTPMGKTVRITGGTVNIRQGNSADYPAILVAQKGDVYEYVATAANGWHAVSLGGDVGWVSGKYSEVIEDA